MTSWPCDERWVDNLWGTLLSQRPPFWLRRHQVSPRLNFRYRPQIQAPLRDQVQWLENISDDGAYWRYVYINMLLQYRGTLPKIFKILNVKINKRTGDLYFILRHAVNRNAVFFKLNRNTEFFNATSRYIVSILRKTSSWIQVVTLLNSSCNIAEVFATLNQRLEFETETVSQQWCHDDTPTHFLYRMHKPHMNFE